MGIEAKNRLLARTINIGLHLGAATEDDWAVDVSEAILDAARLAGFSAVRLGVHWAAHCQAREPHAIDPEALRKVDAVVAWAEARGLAIVLSNVLDSELMKAPAVHKARFLSITRQIARRYERSPESLLLELLAEPRERLDAVWNACLAQGLAAARESNPARGIVVGPATYNNARMLGRLRLPADDRNLVVTVHHYWPLSFTLQGEAWLRLPWYARLFLGNPKSWPGTRWEGTSRERAIQRRMLDRAAVWGRRHDRPIFLGEFGSSNTADMASRARWAGYVRTLCEERGFSWGYWSYGPGFALHDAPSGRWHAELLTALIDP